MLVTLKEVLSDAQKKHYAVGLFNTVNLEMLRGVLEAAEEENSPVIVGTAQVLFPYGPIEMLAAPLLEQAKKATVPVVVHLDHGLDFETVVRAIGLGFSSVMFDGSSLPYAENVSRTKEIVRIAHILGVSVEAELGHVGDASKGDGNSADLYTRPEDALEFSRETDVDALAVAIGTAHGQYKVKPRLDFERLREIRSKVEKPLVLHGGSGLSDDDFRSCVRDGISKVNIFTDLTLAAAESMKEAARAELPYLDAVERTVDAVRAETVKKIRLFGSNGQG